ncbi:MAG: molybdopterin converting factor subunit 1 [Halieaceae bacterium]|nr:molybdopterin converting factor subunit 1 [Halieaceae bacterium]
MIKVLFFARIREQLGCDGLEIGFRENMANLAALQASLIAAHEPRWEQVLNAPNVIRAVNQQLADLDHPLSDGDEVAFFPPVTGG